MKFGKVDNPEDINFTAPQDTNRPATHPTGELHAFIGCCKWNRAHLKNFYPPGTIDELAYYSTQFNSIELTATFYRLFPPSQFIKWRETTAHGFRFFPKIWHDISHCSFLKTDVDEKIDTFVSNASHLEDKLGVMFLQLDIKMGPDRFNDVDAFVKRWRDKYSIPLAIEARHKDWHNNGNVSEDYYRLLEDHQIANIILDTAGRRDLMHMRMTTPTAFIRFVGCNNDPIDYRRLDDWAVRIADWKEKGLVELYFFLHQNIERESPKLAAYFIEKLNKEAGLKLKPPTLMNRPPPSLEP